MQKSSKKVGSQTMPERLFFIFLNIFFGRKSCKVHFWVQAGKEEANEEQMAINKYSLKVILERRTHLQLQYTKE